MKEMQLDLEQNRTKSFETVIKNFKDDQKQETDINTPIQSSSIGLGDKLTKDAVSENVINAIYFWK